MKEMPEWFVFVLFMCWGIGLLNLSIARYIRYRKYQRDPWLLADAIERLFMGVAFCMGSMVVAPHPLGDYDWMITPSRYLWLIGFVPFSIGTLLDWYSLATIERERSKSGGR